MSRNSGRRFWSSGSSPCRGRPSPWRTGELLDEPYIAEFSRDSYPETVVPEGCYLVLGDHRTNSNDARYWADPFVRREDLLARGLFVYFPRFHTF